MTNSDALEHAGGGETRWRMLVGMGADVAFGCLQTACVDTTMKTAGVSTTSPNAVPAGSGDGRLST